VCVEFGSVRRLISAEWKNVCVDITNRLAGVLTDNFRDGEVRSLGKYDDRDSRATGESSSRKSLYERVVASGNDGEREKVQRTLVVVVVLDISEIFSQNDILWDMSGSFSFHISTRKAFIP